MRRMNLVALLALGALLGGCGDLSVDIGGPRGWDGWEGWEGNTFHVVGSGIAATDTFEVEDFDGLKAWGVGTVIIRRTGRERLTVTGDENILRYLDVDVTGRTLEIGPQPRVDFTPRQELVFELEVQDLTHIMGSGAVAFDAVLDEQSSLYVTLSGATTLDADGVADVLDVGTSGASRFSGRRFRARSARVMASGASTAIVWATERLDGSASGVASIRYLGEPDVRVSVSGGASISRY